MTKRKQFFYYSNVCFGKFNLECEAVDVGASDCDCANQVLKFAMQKNKLCL